MENMKRIIALIDGLNRRIGHVVAWCAIYMVLVQFAVVILRYVFAMSFIAVVETVWYSHGLLFMLGAGYTLLHDGHVRVDVIYGDASDRTRAIVDLLGSVFFLLPVAFMIFWFSRGYIINSWKVFEVSAESGGLPLVFAYKTVIWAFAILIGLQGIAMALRAIVFLRGGAERYFASPAAAEKAARMEHAS